MTDIPVYCTDCKIMFNSGYSLENSFQISFKDNLTSCPKCKNLIKIPNGIYSESNNLLKIINSQNDEFYNGIFSIYHSNFDSDLKLKLIDQIFLHNTGQTLSETIPDTSRKLKYDSKLILIYFYKFLKGIGTFANGLKAIEWIIDKF